MSCSYLSQPQKMISSDYISSKIFNKRLKNYFNVSNEYIIQKIKYLVFPFT